MSKRWTGAMLTVLVAVVVIGGTPPRREAIAAEPAERMVVMVYQVTDLPVWLLGKPGQPPTFDSSLLVAHIRAITGRDAWQDGAIEVHETTASLVIRQTQAHQRTISDALSDLRASRAADERDAKRKR